MENSSKKENNLQGGHKGKSGLDKFMNGLGKVQDVISITCFTLMSIIVLVGVTMRYVLKTPFPWGEEAARYLMIIGIMFGIGMGVRERAHLWVEMFINVMPKKICDILSSISLWLTTLVYLYLTYLSFEFIKINYHFGQRTASLNLPIYILYFALLFGFLISAIENIIITYKKWIEKSGKTDIKEGI